MSAYTPPPDIGKYFAFPLDGGHYDRAITVIANIRSADNKRYYRADLTDVIVESIAGGLDYFLLHPLEVANVNSIGRRATTAAVRATKRGIFPVAKMVVNGLNDQQLLDVCDFIEGCIVVKEPNPQSPS